MASRYKGRRDIRLFLLPALLLPWVARAQSLKSCVRKTGSSYQEPKTLSQLMECQANAMLDFIKRYERKKRKEPPDALLDRLGDRQRAEVRGYLRRHPNRASVELKPSEVRQGVVVDEEPEGDDGVRKGITPEMARQIIDGLSAQQGAVSPDMKQLLDAVQRDGPNLSKDTIDQLKRAARQAKREGLRLNVPPDVEESLR